MTHWVDERRQEPRYPARGRVHASIGAETWDAEVLDISLNGALLSKPRGVELKIGDRVEVALSFQGATEFEAAAMVAHVMVDRCGIEFRGMSTADFDRFVGFILTLVGHEAQSAPDSGTVLVGAED